MQRPLVDPPHTGAVPVIRVGRARPSRLTLVLRWLVGALVGINLLVLALLVAVTMVAGGDSGADVATESTGGADGPRAAATASESADDRAVAGSADGLDTVDDIGVDGTAGDPVEPVDEVLGVSTEPPPYPDPFEPTVNEVQPEAKRMGAMVAYLITNYEADASFADVLATLPPGSAQIEGLVNQVQIVHHPGMWSRGTVEYVQLGGHLNGRISNIVVIRQDLGVEGSSEPERTETRVMEVRLERNEAGDWEFYLLGSSGGVPIERPADASPLMDAVVDHPRIDLPDSAAWDIYSGHTDPAVLQLMLDVAERSSYAVAVLRTGHSYNVFETDRVSNHSVGLAVDIYKLESELVVDSHATWSNFYELSEWLVSRTDIKEFGSPWRFPDAVAHTFTNEVHHDHLHIGVYRAPAR